MDKHWDRLRVETPHVKRPPSEYVREQVLDAWNVEAGILNCAYAVESLHNPDTAAAMSAAVNDWMIHEWLEKEPRLRASLVVPARVPEMAAKEIDRVGGHPGVVQVFLPVISEAPYGHRRYWPIFEAAQRCNRPIALHVQGFSGGHASTASGWPTYYMEEHYAATTGMQNTLTSLVFEGVFERFPKLKIVLVEGGFAWAPALCWRMDKHWDRLRVETPHVKRPPSEYVREHVWFTTQPIEEPDNAQHLAEVIDWLGWDRLMFSTDYPHWDFDDPQHTFKFAMTEAQKAKVFRDNAKALYALP